MVGHPTFQVGEVCGTEQAGGGFVGGGEAGLGRGVRERLGGVGEGALGGGETGERVDGGAADGRPASSTSCSASRESAPVPRSSPSTSERSLGGLVAQRGQRRRQRPLLELEGVELRGDPGLVGLGRCQGRGEPLGAGRRGREGGELHLGVAPQRGQLLDGAVARLLAGHR